jgi:bifunctional DNase/RNase
LIWRVKGINFTNEVTVMEDIVEVEVFEILLDESVKAPVVVLKEKNGDRVLPIWIGQAEAISIAYAMEEIGTERPLTHDLIKLIIDGFGARLDKVVINDLKDNTYYARLIFKMDSTVISIDARPSDSIAIALRTKSPIFVAEKVLEEGGTKAEQ